ncbi:hypothetical protein PoHVEF18_003017 [Penicillium ochrochloron]
MTPTNPYTSRSPAGAKTSLNPDLTHEQPSLATMDDYDLDDGQENSRMGGSLWLDDDGVPKLFIEELPSSSISAMLIAGWTHVSVRNPQYDVLRSLAIWIENDPFGSEQALSEPRHLDSDGANDDMDQLHHDSEEVATPKSTPRTNRRVNLTDKAGAGLADANDDSVNLIDQIVDPANLRKGYSRMKGKEETDLQPSLKKLSQLERQSAQLNDAAVTALIAFNPSVRKQFRMHFDKQGRLFKKHFPLLQQTKRVGKDDIPIFDLDTKISNCRDYAKTAAFVNQPSLVTSGGEVRKRKPKQMPDLRDDKGLYVKRQKLDTQETAKESTTSPDITISMAAASEETLVKVILKAFERLEALRKSTGKKDLKTKHEFIRQIAELRQESNLAINAVTRDRAKTVRKNDKLQDKNNRLRNLVHKLRTELNELRTSAGMSPSDLADISDDSDQERLMERVKALAEKTGQKRRTDSGDEDMGGS